MDDTRFAPLAEPRTEARETLGFRPLYRQVRDALTRRIADGVWQPGQTLPSEAEIAADLGVSQGTVRKALDALEAENLVLRRQGKGTFVAGLDEDAILFRYFKLYADSGERRFPDSRILGLAVGAADARAAELLSLRRGAHVVRIDRLRALGGAVCIYERITLPKAMFPGIERRDLPNNLYELYRSEFGVRIVRATERLKAVAATRLEARHLGGTAGDPLLSIDRTAFGIDGRAAEWRLSLCRTDSVHYLSDLR